MKNNGKFVTREMKQPQVKKTTNHDINQTKV
jgi:hypothetical protein